ncbi:MAG: hypothetical protein CFE23_07380 [Flavobacterium sp. BFFFF1]|nr:MAG: hypothetical protein CFE23_07380 [Flavobacterium sp. BFFFF1]
MIRIFRANGRVVRCIFFSICVLSVTWGEGPLKKDAASSDASEPVAIAEKMKTALHRTVFCILDEDNLPIS